MRLAPLLLLVLTTGGSFLGGVSGTKTEDGAPDPRAPALELRQYVEDLAARHTKLSRAVAIDLGSMTGRDLLALELFDRNLVSKLLGSNSGNRKSDPLFQVIVNVPNDCGVKMQKTVATQMSMDIRDLIGWIEPELLEKCRSTSPQSLQFIEYSISRGAEVVISDRGIPIKTMKEFKNLRTGDIFYALPVAKSIGKAQRIAKDVDAMRLKKNAKDAKKAAKAQRS